MQSILRYSAISCILVFILPLSSSSLPSPLFFFSLLLPSFLKGRSKWPKKFTIKLLIQLVLISFGGVTLFQTLQLRGINLTSPATATAMPNLGPGFIFVIAWALGLEKVKLSSKYSKCKIVGTLLCVIGALIMSIMHSTISDHFETEPNLISPSDSPSHHYNNSFNKDKIIGCVYLISAILVLSSVVVLQAATLGDFPAPISMCAITSLIGVVITGVVQLIQEHTIETGWPLLSVQYLIGYSLLAGSISGACSSFSGWAMKKRGPVLVSMFSPIGSVISVILSLFLGDSIDLGSLLGMFVMFTGLYFVLWAKGKEDISTRDNNNKNLESESDVEKPLLS
ncbi:hypothetical protein LguiA_015468 [Lonicera macranthoides]